MLTSDQLDSLVEPVMELYEQYSQSVINDIARRLAGLDFARPTAAWQMQRLSESGKVYENILDELARLTGKSETELRAMFEKAGVRAMKFDDSVYRAAGLNPLPLNMSPAMAQVLAAGLRKTQGVVRNLTMTTALDGQNAFIEAADLAYMQVTSGAMSYSQAVRDAVLDVSKKGLSVIQFPGRKDQLDVAIRRTLLTGVNQTVGQLQVTRADEFGQDLVAVSAHIGARNTGVGPANHESWQGKVYSRSGASRGYQPFVETTGYGTGLGLCGWNCRHSFYPFFEGISENAYSKAELESYANKTVTYNSEEMSFYEATQKQRYIERKIRYWKRQEEALKAAKKDASQQTAKVRQWQAEMRGFTKQTGLIRQGERERIVKIASGSKLAQSPIRVVLPSQDKDIALAQKGKLFTLDTSRQNLVYKKPIDFSDQYKNEQIKANQIILTKKQKAYILRGHADDFEWLSKNQEFLVKAIAQPQYIDKLPRPGKHALNIAHVIPIKDDNSQFLNIVISYHNDRKRPAQIWTLYRASHEYLFFDNGNLKPRWLKIR